jgi:hypothetical protein
MTGRREGADHHPEETSNYPTSARTQHLRIFSVAERVGWGLRDPVPAADLSSEGAFASTLLMGHIESIITSSDIACKMNASLGVVVNAVV